MSNQPTTTFLERIVATTSADLAERRASVPLEAVRERAAAAPAPRDFAAALRPLPNGPARLIAEVKRASPSKGLLAETFDPVAQATAYAAGGAAAISVLTEPHFFLGSLEHLSAVRAAVSVPVLRKDFLIDTYQIYEARAAGADAVLLICALLDDAQLSDYLALTRSLGMAALVEAHNAEEARRAVASGARIIGANSRDLRTFHVDTDVVRHLRPLIPADRVFIAESGIGDTTGAAHARAWGADAILVGEALMRAPDPTVKVHELASTPGGATAALFAGASRPFIKLCGLRAPEQAMLATELGADAIGLVFAPSRRRVTPEQACAIVHATGCSMLPDRDEDQRAGSGVSPISTALCQRPLPLQGSGVLHWGWLGVRSVGVFVNEAPATIAAIVATVGLDAIQLSGDESPDDCAAIIAQAQLPIIKALRLREEADLPRLDAYVAAGATLLLDSPAADGSYGGTGQIGDWALARRAAERWPIILSGGLTPENVAPALEAVSPCGIDVSSGIETNGVKDPAKMRAFVIAAKTATNVTTAAPSLTGKGVGG